jgi:AraC-like DNA-binding protein
MIEYKEFTPKDSRLKKYIHSYTSSIGVLEQSGAKYITRAFPSYLTQFYFEFYGSLSQIVSDKKSEIIEKRTYINTQIDRWFDVYQIESKNKKRAIKNFKVDLYPHTLYEVFRISSQELINHDVKIEDIWGSKALSANLYEELESSVSGEEMVRVFEKYFLEKLQRTQKENSFTHLYLQTNNNLELLSKKLGYSTRWIQKEHKELFGLSFKELQSNMRFLKTVDYISNLVENNTPINLSLLSLECGYYDQAHFIKEFKKYSGFTPKEYLKIHLHANVPFYW